MWDLLASTCRYSLAAGSGCWSHVEEMRAALASRKARDIAGDQTIGELAGFLPFKQSVSGSRVWAALGMKCL